MANINIKIEGCGKNNGRKMLAAIIANFLKSSGFQNIIVTRNSENIDKKMNKLNDDYLRGKRSIDYNYISAFNDSKSLIEIETYEVGHDSLKRIKGALILGKWDCHYDLIESKIEELDCKSITGIRKQLIAISNTDKQLFPMAVAFLVVKGGNRTLGKNQVWLPGEFVVFINGEWIKIDRKGEIIR